MKLVVLRGPIKAEWTEGKFAVTSISPDLDVTFSDVKQLSTWLLDCVTFKMM